AASSGSSQYPHVRIPFTHSDASTPAVTTLSLHDALPICMDMFNIRGFDNFQNYYDGLQLLYNDWNLQPQIDLKAVEQVEVFRGPDRKSTRLNSSHVKISYAVFCLEKKSSGTVDAQVAVAI